MEKLILEIDYVKHETSEISIPQWQSHTFHSQMSLEVSYSEIFNQAMHMLIKNFSNKTFYPHGCMHASSLSKLAFHILFWLLFELLTALSELLL